MVKELLKNKKMFLCLYFLNVLLFVPLIVYGGRNFSIDSYGIALDSHEHIEAFVSSYRWVGALIYQIFSSLTGHNPISDSTIDVIVFIVIVAMFTTLLTLCVMKVLDKKDYAVCVAVNLGIVVSVFNVWLCSVLSFPECVFITAIGFCFCFGAVMVYITATGWVKYIISGILLVLSTGIYQQFISMFTIYTIAICGVEIISKNKTAFKEIVLHYIKPAIMILVSGIVYFTLGKAFQIALNIEPNSRVNLSITGIIDNLIYFAKNQHSYLKGRGYFESELLTVCFLLVGLIWFIHVVKEWVKSRNTVRSLFLILSYAFAYVSAYLPGILSTSHAARAMFALFTVFSLFSTGILYLSKNRFVKVALCGILSIVFVMNISVSIKSEMIQKEQNTVDRIWCESVLNEISRYENENNTKIETIEFCYDKESDLTLKSSESASLYEYSLRAMVNYYSDKDMRVIEISDEKYISMFGDKEWDGFVKEEQLIFDDTVLYLCCY